LIEELKLAIAAAESGVLESVVTEVFAAQEQLIALGSNSSIRDSLNSWKEKIKNQRFAKPIDNKFAEEINYYQQINDYSNEAFCADIEQIVKQLSNDSPFYEQAKALLTEQKREPNPLFKHHFCEQWHDTLFNHIKEERLKELKREELLEELYQRSDTISQLNEINGEVDEDKNLRLWDMANTKLSKRDIGNLKNITRALRKNSELQQIADKLGRMAKQIESTNSSNIKTEKFKQVETENIATAGNIVGIHDSDDIERMLTTEAMYLTMPELETVFYKRLADKQLATYQLQSSELNNEKVSTFEEQPQKGEEDKGPFVIAIDASGSMMGTPEQYAKAFAYGLMQIALAEGRECYIIIFSTQQITYEVSSQKGLSEILSFLSYTFNGGTDLTPVLEQSIELMSSEKYYNADLIIISDFIAPPQPEEMVNKITELKERKNRFHALNLSKYGNPELLAIFDHYWEYFPSGLSRLKRLIKHR
jgi:uncharacterized protein with von Willebrand factor type A (vWA) domain